MLRLILPILSSIVLVVASLGLVASLREEAAADYGAVDQVAIDMNIAGNSATSLEPTDGCKSTSVGSDIQFDIVARGVPGPDNGGDGAGGYTVILKYDPSVLYISAAEPLWFASDGYLFSDPLPDSDGSLFMDVSSSIHQHGKTGDAVLFRMTAHVIATGTSQLVVSGLNDSAAIVYDPNGNEYPILDIFGGLIAANQSCPAVTPTPTPRFGAVSGKVEDKHGHPIAGAEVSLGGFYHTTTDALGNYLLENVPTGSYIGGAGAPGYQSLYWTSTGGAKTNGESITVLGAQTTTGIDFRLGAVSVVTGRVVDAQGQPLAGAQVGAGASSAVTNEDGRYSITDMSDGDVMVLAMMIGRETVYWSEAGPTHQQSDATVLHIDNGTDQKIENIDFALRKIPRVTGHVFDAQGNPVEGACVQFSGGDSCDPYGYGVPTLADGSFDVGFVDPGSLPSGAPVAVADGFYTSFWTPSGGTIDPREGRVQPSLTYEQDFSTMDFHLIRPGSISGRITDSSGNPIPQIQIQFWPPDPCFLCSIDPPDAQGYFHASVEPGDYKLYVYAGSLLIGGYWTALGGDPTVGDVIHVGDGADVQEINFVLYRGSYVRGFVRDAGGAPLNALRVDLLNDACSPCSGWFTYPDGSFLLYSRPGTFKLRVTGAGYKTTYWSAGGSVTDPSQASPLTIQEGVDVDNLDLVVPTENCASDQNGDTVVDAHDALLVLLAMGSQPDSPLWRASADLDHNGTIESFDLLAFLKGAVGLGCTA